MSRRVPRKIRKLVERSEAEHAAALAKKDDEVKNWRRVAARAREEVDAEKHELGNLLEKLRLYTVRVHRDDSGRESRYRLMVELDPRIVRDVAMHGNDRRLLGYIAERVGHDCLRELHTINFERFQ